MAVLILPATASALASSAAIARTLRNLTFFAVPPLVSAETGTIQISPDNGANWVDLPGPLTASNNLVVIIAPGLYRINKSATATATAIYVATEENA